MKLLPRQHGVDPYQWIALGLEARMPVGKIKETHLRHRCAFMPLCRPDQTAEPGSGQFLRCPGVNDQPAQREAVITAQMCVVPARLPGMLTSKALMRVILAGGAIRAGVMASIPMLSGPALAGRPESWRGDPSAAVPERPDG